MPTQKLTQNNFTSGQYDRTVQGKEQSELVASGLAKAMNVVSSESGELRKRLGTKLLMELDENAVVVPFRVPNGNDVLLMCTDGNIAAYQFSGNNLVPVMTPDDNAPVFPTSGWDSILNEGFLVKSSCSGFWASGFNAASSPYYGKGSLFNVENTVQNIPAYISIESSKPHILGSLRVRWVNTCSGNHKGHYKGWIVPVLQYSDDGDSWVSVETDYTNPFSGDPDVYYASHHYGSGSSEKTENYVVYEITNINHNIAHEYWRIWFTQRISNTQTFSGERLEVFVSNVKYVSETLKRFESPTNFTNDVLKKIKYSQDNTTMLIVAEDTQPMILTYSAAGFELDNFKGLTGDGYTSPSSVAFFQNRLWFSGVDGFPTTVLGSKFGDYDEYKYSLTITTGAQYDDALNLKSNQLRSKIKNIVGSQNVLYCFSEDGISFVDGGGNGLIATNQSIEFNLKNRMPAGDATPTFKDDILLYTSADGTKLYAVDYDMVVERFQVEDIAKYAKDVINGKMTELHFINNESKLIYGLMDNNNMFALLYKKGEYNGFFPMSIQNGYVYDICPIKHNRDYKLIMVTNRSGRWYLEEKLDKGKFINTADPLMSKEEKKWATYDNLENNIALDCYKSYNEGINVTGRCDGLTIVTDASVDFNSLVGKTVLLCVNNNPENHILAQIIEVIDQYSAYVTVIDSRGNLNIFDVIYPEFTRFPTSLPQDTEVAVISEGRYIGEYSASNYVIKDTLYCWWVFNTEEYIYTLSKTPAHGDLIYNSFGEPITIYAENFVADYSGNILKVNSALQENGVSDLYGWGDGVYTVNSTPSVGDALYDENGVPLTSYYDNTVYSVSDTSISVVADKVVYEAQYAWRSGTDVLYSKNDAEYKDWATLFSGESYQVDTECTSIVYDGVEYFRDKSKDGTRRVVSQSQWSGYFLGFTNGNTTYFIQDVYINQKYTTSQRIYKETSSGVVNGYQATVPINYTKYIKYEGRNFYRDVDSDVVSETKINTITLERNASIDKQSITLSSYVVKDFQRKESNDIMDGGIYIDLPFPVHKVIYGATYEAYGIIKIEKPYESMKSVQQINLSVIDTAHLQVGTGFNDLQELEQIKDDSHYDLTNITMNGSYRVVPSDTPEWEKYIILRSVKGLPFTVVGLEAFVNYSNMGGN